VRVSEIPLEERRDADGAAAIRRLR
jgi:hypothetical protein